MLNHVTLDITLMMFMQPVQHVTQLVSLVMKLLLQDVLNVNQDIIPNQKMSKNVQQLAQMDTLQISHQNHVLFVIINVLHVLVESLTIVYLVILLTVYTLHIVLTHALMVILLTVLFVKNVMLLVKLVLD